MSAQQIKEAVAADKPTPPEAATLWDEFAMRAMQSILLLDVSHQMPDALVADQSYDLADAMLAERNSRQNPTEGSPAASGV